jgi:hypothetical protein
MPLFFQYIGRGLHQLHSVTVFTWASEENNRFHYKTSLVNKRFIICLILGSGQEDREETGLSAKTRVHENSNTHAFLDIDIAKHGCNGYSLLG